MSEESNVSGETYSEAAVPVAENQSETHSGEQERNVPLDALQAERSERQKLQDELRMVKDNLALMQMAQQRSQQPPPDETESLSEDDVLTVRDAKKFISKMNKEYQMSIQELRMSQKHPDYQQVVTKYLPEVLKTNPSLRSTLEQTQDYELAYYLAKNSDSYKSDHKKAKKNADAERIVENASRTGSLSSVGQTSPINTAKRYRDMSDDEFRKTVQRNLGYM